MLSRVHFQGKIKLSTYKISSFVNAGGKNFPQKDNALDISQPKEFTNGNCHKP